VIGMAFVHGGRGAHRGAALPFLDDARIARWRHRTGTEVGVDVDAVLVDPAQAALGLRSVEAVLHPGLGGEVEFTGDIGVGTTGRECDQAALVGWLEARRAMPYPLLALGTLLGFVECVDVEHGFPRRLRLAVLVERGAAPHATLVLRVLPDVVVVRADLL